MNILLNPSRSPVENNIGANTPVLTIESDELSFLKIIPQDGVSSVYIFDFLYSLSEEEGKALIDESMRVAKHQVVISNIHPDHLNSNQNLRSLQSNVLKQQSNWDLYNPDGTTTISFNIKNNPNKISNRSDGFFKIIPSEKSFDVPHGEFCNTPRLIIISEIPLGGLDIRPNDFVIVDIHHWNTSHMNSKNNIPMYLKVLVKNINLPNHQLRKFIANYNLLEAYINSSKEIITYGHEARLILEYIQFQSRSGD